MSRIYRAPRSLRASIGSGKHFHSIWTLLKVYPTPLISPPRFPMALCGPMLWAIGGRIMRRPVLRKSPPWRQLLKKGLRPALLVFLPHARFCTAQKTENSRRAPPQTARKLSGLDVFWVKLAMVCLKWPVTWTRKKKNWHGCGKWARKRAGQ